MRTRRLCFTSHIRPTMNTVLETLTVQYAHISNFMIIDQLYVQSTLFTPCSNTGSMLFH
jgi:hypothetical protein